MEQYENIDRNRLVSTFVHISIANVRFYFSMFCMRVVLANADCTFGTRPAQAFTHIPNVLHVFRGYDAYDAMGINAIEIVM